MEPKTRPGRNGGGALKSGNTVGVGRKPSEIRDAMRHGVDVALPFLIDVSKGLKCIDTGRVDEKTGKSIMRHPNYSERADAFDKLAKYSIGTRIDMTSGDEPVKMYVNVDDSRM